MNNPSTRYPDRITILILLLIAAGGMAALWASTPYGLGLSNDSAYYIEGARNIQAGQGYVRTSGGGEIKPITHFPPFFSIALALIDLVGPDTFLAARVAVVAFFGITIFLAGLSAYAISHSRAASWLAAAMLACSDVFLGVYAMALSEPLFLALMLAAFLFLSAGIAGNRLTRVAAAGFLLSLAVLARYAGLSLIAAGAAGILIFYRPRAWKALACLAASAAPLLIGWLVYSQAATGSGAVGNRLLNWHPPQWTMLFEGWKNLLTWLAPDWLLAVFPAFGRIFSLLSLLILPALAFFLFFGGRRAARQPGTQGSPILAALLALQVLLYLAFVLISLTLFDASTPLDSRILAPAYLALLVLFAAGVGWLLQAAARGGAAPGWAASALVIIVLASGLVDGVAAVRQLGREGLGFTHRGWQQSPAIQAVRQLPTVILYSNRPTAIYLLTGRSAYILPTPVDAVTSNARPDYEVSLDAMKTSVLKGDAVLVIFELRTSTDPFDTAYFENLTSGLPVLADFGRDIVFGLPR